MPHIAVVTPVFPNSADPFRGIFNYYGVLALQQWAEVEVYCMMAAYPQKIFKPLSRSYRRVDTSYSLPEVKVHYVEYPALPLVTRPFNSRTCARRLLPLLKKNSPDLILAFWIYPEGMASVIVGKKLGIPVIVKALGSDLRAIKDPFTYLGVRRTLRQADLVLTVSEELRQRAIAMGVPPEGVQKILNGCDSSVFRLADRSTARTELGVDADAQLVLFVGRLTAAKGIRELHDAIARLAPSRPRLRLVCIGEDVLGEAERARSSDPRLAGRVQFLGRSTPAQVARWLAAANLLCLPSYSEGCPNVLIEALHCGRAVVASNVGGIPEMVDPSCAILVPPKDAERLAKALAKALEHKWDEAAISLRFGRSWEDMGRETFEACEALLKGRTKSSS